MSHSKRLDPSPKNGILRVVKKVFDRPYGNHGQWKPGRSNVVSLFSPTKLNREQPKNLLRCILSYFRISCNGCSFYACAVRSVITTITTGANHA